MAHMRARLARNVFGVLAALALLAVPAAVLAGPETLVYSWTSNVGELNPHLYSPNQMFAQAMVYDPLVRYGEGGAIKPALAEKWEISPDGKTYTFTLRQA
jgi:nickel transport system substrate-binding protein